MLDEVIHVIVVDIICFVDHDRVFLETLNAFMAMKIYALICTLDFFRSMRIFVILVQICIFYCAFEGISKVYDISGRYKFVRASSLFILSHLFFVPFLLFFIGCVVRLSTFVSIVA